MNYHTRLSRLEKQFPKPKRRGIPASAMSDERLYTHLTGDSKGSGIFAPPLPWSNADRAAVHAFWDATYGHEKGLNIFGFSPYQLFLSFRHTAVAVGLQVSDDYAPRGHERPEDLVDLGPYEPYAGGEYRERLKEIGLEKLLQERQQGGTNAQGTVRSPAPAGRSEHAPRQAAERNGHNPENLQTRPAHTGADRPQGGRSCDHHP